LVVGFIPYQNQANIFVSSIVAAILRILDHGIGCINYKWRGIKEEVDSQCFRGDVFWASVAWIMAAWCVVRIETPWRAY
jgi:hypothetical protein